MPHLTIPDADARIAYTGNGVTTAFAFNHPFFALTDMVVYVNGTLTLAGFTPTGVAVDGGYSSGTITFAAAPANGASVVIVRSIPIQRLTDFPYPSQTLDLKALNTELDRAFAIMRDMKRMTELAVRANIYEPGVGAGVGSHTYDLWMGHASGPWTDGQVLWEGQAVRSFRIDTAADFWVHMHAAPEGLWVGQIKVAGVAKATVSVGAGANNGGVTLLAGAITINNGNLIELVGPTPADGTAAGIAITARGTKI